MNKAALIIDGWKMPIFRRHLETAGYKFDEPIQFTAKAVLIRVYYEWAGELKPVVEAAQLECDRSKK